MSETAFSGFTGEAVGFLKDLKADNTRDWFTANKKIYESRDQEARGAVRFGHGVGTGNASPGRPHKTKVFRINRDVRFSKDKTPYNSHLHISFTPESTMAVPPAWMFGLAPDYFTLGCGVFEFGKGELERFRVLAAGDDGAKLLDLIAALGNDGLRVSEPGLKRVPSGFDKDHPNGDLLRRKGLIAWLDFAGPETAVGPRVVETCTAGLKRLQPLFEAMIALED